MSRADRLLIRSAVLAVLVGGLAVGTAPVAVAAPAGGVVPVLDCVRTEDDGSWTFVLGYTNTTGATATLAVGPDNQITPTRYGSPQPTSFERGEHHGVFTVSTTHANDFVWHLDATNLKVRADSPPACSAAHQLPATGNGTGIAVGLLAAAGVGVVALRRAVRRSPDAF